MAQLYSCALCGEVGRSYCANRRYCVPCGQRRQSLTGGLAAINAVRRAVLRGDMPRPTELVCVDCGAPAKHYDHRDYNKPLEVEPVCISCNWHRGPAKYIESYKLAVPFKTLAEKKAERLRGAIAGQAKPAAMTTKKARA